MEVHVVEFVYTCGQTYCLTLVKKFSLKLLVAFYPARRGATGYFGCMISSLEKL